MLARSLRDALLQTIRELTESAFDSEAATRVLTRSLRLRLSSESTWLNLGDPSTLDTQGLDLIPLQQVAKAIHAVELPRGGLAEVVDVVSSDQFEQSMGDQARIANEILALAGWEQPVTGDPNEWFSERAGRLPQRERSVV